MTRKPAYMALPTWAEIHRVSTEMARHWCRTARVRCQRIGRDWAIDTQAVPPTPLKRGPKARRK